MANVRQSSVEKYARQFETGWRKKQEESKPKETKPKGGRSACVQPQATEQQQG
jgi:hypothetical protein